MKKITAICLCAAILSGTVLLLQGCGSSGQNDAAQQETQEDTSRKKEQNSANSTAPENDSDTDTSYSAAGDSNDDPASDAADPSGSQSDPESIASSLACPSVNGALRVQGTQLVDKDGNPVQLRGISTHGLAWFPDYVNEACFQQLREEWQANVIRLAMYTAEYGGFCTGGDREFLKQLIQDGVTYAEKQDMYVVLDWHILSDSNPNMYLEEAKTFFQEMAGKYAGSDHILYEICNEPNGSTTWNDIKAYAEQVIPVIRSEDEDAVILVGTPNWSQFVDQAAADPITGYDNLMYTLHFYAATHTDDLRSKMVEAVENSLPIFVSEYGICDAGGSGAIDEAQANLWVETMDDHGISYIAWNLSNKEESSAMLNSSCGKSSGFSPEDLSESGKWVYEMLRSHITSKKASTL